MLRVMQIGYGYWGTNVAKKLIASNMLEFCYLAETDPQRREDAEGKFSGQVKIVEDYRKYLDTDIDGVVICTQTKYSFEIAMEAMERGKHVFIEKPIASDVCKAEQLIAKAREKGLILHCDHLMVYNPIIKYIKRMIDRGDIGDVMYIDVARVNLGPIRKDINAMLDLAVHDLALVDYLLGGIEPDSLSAYGTKFFGEQETATYLTMRCGKILININSSWISPIKVRRMTIAGTNKMLVMDDLKTDDKLSIYDRGIEIVQGREYGEYEYKTRIGDIFIPHIEMSDSLQNSLEHFAGCVLEHKESLSGPDQSLRVMKVLEEAQQKLNMA
jgi:predicted dehydrogenase